MTSKQRQAFDAIKKFHVKHGYPPTFQEIGILCGGLTSGAVQGRLRGLVKKGILKYTAGESRSFVFLKEI